MTSIQLDDASGSGGAEDRGWQLAVKFSHRCQFQKLNCTVQSIVTMMVGQPLGHGCVRVQCSTAAVEARNQNSLRQVNHSLIIISILAKSAARRLVACGLG